MTLLGLVVGLPAEARTLARNRPARGTIQELDAETLLVVSGIGPARAQRAGEALIARGAAGILSWGIAGGLDPALRTGTLLLPDKVIGTDGGAFPTDSGWRQRFLERLQGGPAAVIRPLAETAAPAADPSSKRRLFEATGAAAVDMESAGAARGAAGGGCPFLAVRVVADPAGMTLPRAALAALDGEGRLRPMRLLAALARHPRQWGLLTELRGAFRKACATLSEAAQRCGPGFAFLP
ncbi:MAG: purine phosphorylase [Planctomycetota bacterium]